MNKSEAYYLAQVCVVNAPTITPGNKLEILKVLIEDERFALYSEERAEKGDAE